MIGKIRLADRRGVLAGPKAGPVQTLALEILLVHETIQEAQGKIQDSLAGLRGGLAALGTAEERIVLPGEEDDEDAMEMGSTIEPKDAMAVLEALGESGTMTMEDVRHG